MPLDVIVEIGNSHEGSLGIAKSFVEMVAETGAKTVKFQMHLAEHEGTRDEPFRKIFSAQDQSRADYWRRVNFTPDGWRDLVEFTLNQGLEFLCTPFSREAADLLIEMNAVKRWKVGSGDAPNIPFIDHLIQTNLPIVLSTGLVSWQEILKIVDRFELKNAKNRLTLMHCVSMYPTPLESSSLNLIDELKKLGVGVGLSDHSGKVSTALSGIAKGIKTLEVHMAPHRKFFGPDTTSSLLPDEISTIIEISRDWDVLNAHPNSKELLFNQSEPLRKIFRKGIYWAVDKKVGAQITFEDLRFLKPVQGLDAIDFEGVLGKKIHREVSAGEPLSPTDFEG
jgi:N-acetylneuraminate synthase